MTKWLTFALFRAYSSMSTNKTKLQVLGSGTEFHFSHPQIPHARHRRSPIHHYRLRRDPDVVAFQQQVRDEFFVVVILLKDKVSS